jgi:hypothetical protein
MVMSVECVDRWKVRPVSESFDPVPDPHAVVVFGAARYYFISHLPLHCFFLSYIFL